MKVSFHTLGCKTNAYETQAIREQFLEAGYEIGEFSEPCDVYVINTCAVTAEAARKSRQMTGRCKRRNPGALVVVTGCYAQEAGEELLRETTADLVVGNSEKNEILPLVRETAKGRAVLKDLSACREYEKQGITSGQEGHVRAYVKIQDGCDRFCSYCLIPYLRGRARSRDRADILQEVKELAASGCREIVLTGIDISSFCSGGKEGEDLAGLLEELDRIPGIERIRLGSLEEGIITEPFLKRLVSIASFCPQFHLSLQSGSDTVLKRMNRHYTAEEFYQAAQLIRNYFPAAGITTDIITGFPGETEEEFEETMAFVRKIHFSRLHVFPYSRREGTRADRMPDQLTKAVREERAARLIRLGEQLREEYECRLIGQKCLILTEECIHTENGWFLAGYTPEYVRILLPVQESAPSPQEPAPSPLEREALLNRIISAVPKYFREGCLIAGSRDL